MNSSGVDMRLIINIHSLYPALKFPIESVLLFASISACFVYIKVVIWHLPFRAQFLNMCRREGRVSLLTETSSPLTIPGPKNAISSPTPGRISGQWPCGVQCPDGGGRSVNRPELKGSIGEGTNHSNHSNSFKIQEFSLENSKISENFNIF